MKAKLESNDGRRLTSGGVNNDKKDKPLKGFYFHSIENGKLQWQGIVLDQFDDYVLVLTFEWGMGEDSCGYLMRLSDLAWNSKTKTGFYLYENHELFEHSYEHGMARAAHQKIEKAVGG